MTAALARALEAVQGLPDDEQDRIAAIVLDQIEDAAWERSLAAAPDRLRELGDVAEAEYLRGATELLDPERI